LAERRTFGTQAGFAYETLRGWIFRGKLHPGERIVLRKIAGEVGTSTVPVRDALVQLTHERLVEKNNSGGWSVVLLSEEKLEATNVVRLALEAESARQCARKATQEDIRALAEMAERVDRTAQEPKLGEDEEVDLDQRFHLEIARIGGCRDLEEELRRVLNVFLMNVADVGQRHTDIVEGLATGDPEIAERAMRSHLEPCIGGLSDDAAEGREVLQSDSHMPVASSHQVRERR